VCVCQWGEATYKCARVNGERPHISVQLSVRICHIEVCVWQMPRGTLSKHKALFMTYRALCIENIRSAEARCD